MEILVEGFVFLHVYRCVVDQRSYIHGENFLDTIRDAYEGKNTV